MRLIKKPVLCNYYLTYRCNASCYFCDIWEKPSPYVKFDNLKQNLLGLKSLGVKVIDFTGGEPLLHQELPEYLSYAKSLGFMTTVTTNCLLYPKKAEQLKGNVDMLHFSLDSFDKEEHDTGRGVACYDFVMESIQIAKRLGERPDIIFTAMNSNIDQIEDIYLQICLPNNLVLIINPVFGYNDIDDGGALSEDNLDRLSAYGKMRNIYLNEAFIDLRRNGGNKVADPVCKAASSSIVISPFNELVVPCYHLGKKKFPIDNNLVQLYNSAAVQQHISLEGRMPECEGCTINCYMQPSFAVEMNQYFWKALPSTLKYNSMKGTWKSMLK
ncbi:radical SAM protein [Marivirga atlantica]|jgi:MoaA/NifB/PqqE/SkfB family radical SAM enzyme|uniref:Radical SAM protein n=1 Tax=Marivirga atlantica TaxID=1548457 RepID=A0A937DIC0_9BACT|nr:radical SAM protein [Marivirga atlantica]MBL0763624.1 radical SAM protein [Marivirga atlantica]